MKHLFSNGRFTLLVPFTIAPPCEYKMPIVNQSWQSLNKGKISKKNRRKL